MPGAPLPGCIRRRRAGAALALAGVCREGRLALDGVVADAEAEVLAWGGIPDILVSNEIVGASKLARLAALITFSALSVVGLVCFIFAPDIVRLFVPGDTDVSDDVMGIATPYLSYELDDGRTRRMRKPLAMRRDWSRYSTRPRNMSSSDTSTST